MAETKKHLVIGGGNIGTLVLAELAQKGMEPVLFTNRVSAWGRELSVYDGDDAFCFSTNRFSVTDDIASAVREADIIWITYPSELFADLAKQMLPHVHAGQVLVVMPGAGGVEFAFEALVQKGCILVGFERVHCITRLVEYGHSVKMLGRKPLLHIGSIPSDFAYQFAPDLEDLFEIACNAFPNYLSITLIPSNPILHTTRLYSLFKDYVPGTRYPRNPFFYKDWDDASSEMLISCDKELQGICRSLEKLDLKNVVSLCDYYESHTVPAMTKKITSIKAFESIKSPMKEVEGGWVPDFESRYFKSDFSYGLKIIKDIGNLISAEIENIEQVWNWYIRVSQDQNYFELPDATLEAFYSRYR